MDRLLQIGFREIGNWTSEDGRLRLHLQSLPLHRRALYAFVSDKTILYVGKTSGSLAGRLQAYVAPHPTQRTNVRNRAGLLERLGAGQAIRILGWIDPGLHRYGPFELNMAAGLEDSIIAVLAPPWNGARSAEAVKLHAAAATVMLIDDASATLAAGGAPGGTTADVRLSPVLPTGSTAGHDAPTMAVHADAAGATFTVQLGKTYYKRGFFNVPVAFSMLFGPHGAAMDLYCGAERAHLKAILDRRANQQSGTPRIYGRGELANWFQRRFQLDGTLHVTVLSATCALLS